MPKFIILVGSIKTSHKTRLGDKDIYTSKMHTVGDEIELDADEAERINAKGPILELLEVRDAKAKAAADSKAAIEKAESDAKAKLKGGGK